ncbi:C-type lectin Cal-like isoform X2 [Phaenicophaeus curvirostris]|uniref:C-type lectin Cal-like isoform X2 n=1 Tax=Phaenicophaeus curvirostris TaxID=33595 RepID=UPI0037F0EC06
MGAGPAGGCLLGCLLLVSFLGADSLPAARVLVERAGNSTLEPAHGPESCVTQRVPVRSRSSCPRNWRYYRGFCYGYFAERRTQAEAEEECSRYGPMGTLSSIHSSGAAVVLAEYVAGQNDGANVWIGLKDEEHNRRWKWLDNSALDFTRWDAGQPNNLLHNEFCVVLEKTSGFQFWHDYPCQSRFPFLCQHEL